jgi:hypothetical protein
MLLSFPIGWNLEVPAGTLLIRVDVVMNTRPGAGGYCAIIESADMKENVLIRGGEPETSTDRLMKVLAVRLAEEIRGNRAVILTRSKPMFDAMFDVFKPFKMIRLLAHSPLAVSDATRHAHVMAERSLHRGKPHEERFGISRFEVSEEEFNPNQDTNTLHAALQHLISTVGFANANSEKVREASQEVMDAAEHELSTRQKEVIRKQTSNDIPRATQEKEN